MLMKLFTFTVWKLSPKELILGKESVDIACAIAASKFNDGACSLLDIKVLWTDFIMLLKAFISKKRQATSIEFQV